MSDLAKPSLARYRCAFPVTLRKRSGDLELLSSDVSFRDVFVRTDRPPPFNSLVRLDLTLPSDGAIMSISACVETIVAATPEAEEYPGFVGRFVGLSGPPKARWEELINSLRQNHPGSQGATAKTVVFARRTYLDRFLQRDKLSVKVPCAPATVAELLPVIDTAIAGGTLHMTTPLAIIVGAPISVEVCHPLTEDRIVLPGVARRRDAATSTIEVQLQAASPDDAEALREFADSVVIVEDYDVDVLSGPVLSRR